MSLFDRIAEQTMSGSLVGAGPAGAATTSANIARRDDKGRPFFGKFALAGIEKERRRRLRCLKKGKSDDECDAEAALPGGLPTLRRSPLKAVASTWATGRIQIS